MSEIERVSPTIVMGLGITGLSCVAYLVEQGREVIVMDTRENPPNRDILERDFPQVRIITQDFPEPVLASAQQIIASPGVPLTSPALQFARSKGVEIIGDVELFARHNTIPVIAITGSNGKSTVTTLVGEMAQAAGLRVAVVGNIGEPVLSVLMKDAPRYDLVVMELSSFQLETTSSLQTVAATVLNISADHMDRYPSLQDYVDAKQRIYTHTQHAVLNVADLLSVPLALPAHVKRSYFGLTPPAPQMWGVIRHEGAAWLARGEEPLLPVSALKITGDHNVANALSALALADAAGIPFSGCLTALRMFAGLPHRCQWVANINGVDFINDSKGTNIGACLAAVEGLGNTRTGKLVLLLGGDGKGADFSELVPSIKQYCRAVIVTGKDGALIQAALEAHSPCYAENTLQAVVEKAIPLAEPGDCVLLSPACASTDQYRNFMHRGDAFIETVKALHE